MSDTDVEQDMKGRLQIQTRSLEGAEQSEGNSRRHANVLWVVCCCLTKMINQLAKNEYT